MAAIGGGGAAGSAPAPHPAAAHGSAPGPSAAVVPFSAYPWTAVVVSEAHERREAHQDLARMPAAYSPKMEDKTGGFELPNPLPADGGGTLTCLYVVDGHAGVETAAFVRDNFQRVFVERLQRQLQPPPVQASICAALYDAVLELEHQLRVRAVPGGAVAAFTVLRVNGAKTVRKLYVANVGDVEVALVDDKQIAMTLSRKHTPANPDELARLLAISNSLNPEGGPSFIHGGRLVGDGGFNLAITRTLGDFRCKPWATAEPAIASITLEDRHLFYFIASDGVFDCEFLPAAGNDWLSSPPCSPPPSFTSLLIPFSSPPLRRPQCRPGRSGSV
jgi:serine/threonine protein phosphatase PrpC